MMPGPMPGPYVVEVDDGGCERCGHGKTWTVVGSDQVAIGRSFEIEEDADDLCQDMNAAWNAGREVNA